MTPTLDTSGDLAHADHLETVQFEPAGDPTPLVVSGALRRGARVREGEPSGGRHQVREAVWHLPAAALPKEPRVGSTIVDSSGTRWTVLSAALQTLGGRWRLQTRCVSLRAGWNERITIQRATWRAAPGGEARATWHDWRCGVPGHIEPLEATVQSDDGEYHARATHRLLLGEAISLNENTRVVAAEGTVYEVLRFEPAGQLAATATALLRRLRPPVGGSENP